MYHHYRKDSSYLRSALWDEYKSKCFYCTHIVALRNMHVDHILPTKAETVYDAEILEYLSELQKNGFDFDSIENYAPTCPSCNRDKSNKVYKASSLRFYHDKANRKVDAVLKRIDQLKQSTEEYFYSPVDSKIWETIDFSNQHDISYALLGYRLTPKDVEACPRFPQVERIKKRLAMVHHVNLQGETGCGKSISIYQAAYDFYKDGWNVYRYINQENENTTIDIPSNTENSLYIVDDAQTLSDTQKKHLEEQAKSNTKILFAETITSQHVYYDTILLTNAEAVNILYNDFLQRKDDILPIIHQLDPEVGEDRFDTSIEWRLNSAKKESTPWTFAYVLRGGWRTISENYQSVSSHHNCDLLAAGIAACQIAQLDNSVNFEWLCNRMYNIDSSYMWDQSDLQYLVNMKIVFSEEDVRIIHLESAQALFGYFYMHASAKKKSIILKLIETSYLESIFTTLGVVWLSNGPSRYISDDRQYERELVSDIIISHTFASINQANTLQERIGIAYLWEKLFLPHFHHIGYTYFIQNNTMIREWINHANGEVAYAYSCLINSLRNYNKTMHRRFSKNVDWKMITTSLQDAPSAELYSWGKLINRLACSFTQNDCFTVRIELDKALRAIQRRITINSIESFSSFLCMVSYIAPECVHEMIHVSLPIYQQLFCLETRKMLQLFDLEFLMYICGIGLFVNHKPTEQQIETSESLIRIIPNEQFADVISNSPLRDWDQVYDIMHFITLYNETKSQLIIRKVDLQQLSNSARGFWGKAQDICLLCLALYFGDPSVAQQFIVSNADEIETIYPSFAIIHPSFAISSFLAGKEVKLINDFHWRTSYSALKILIKTDKLVANNIILSNEASIIKGLSDISSVDLENDYCYRFICLLQKTSPEIFFSIAEQINISAIGKGIENSSISRKKQLAKEKRLKKIKEFLRLKEV